MRNPQYEGSPEFRPLSAWSYFGYGVLFAIPIIGWLFLIIFSFSRSNMNRRSFARSYWCAILVIALVCSALFILSRNNGLHSLPALLNSARSSFSSAASSLLGKEAPAAAATSFAGSSYSDFKAFMDSYEAFIDEYIAFMKKYSASSNPSSMLLDYFSYLEKYTDVMYKLDNMNEDELTADEWNYYLEVMLRISKKIATIQ